MSTLPPPPPGSPGVAAAPEVLTPEVAAEQRRIRWLLLLVPFTFPLWLRLRRVSPAAARGLRFELGICVFNSVAIVLLAGCGVSLLAFRQQIIEVLTAWVLETGIVR